MYGTNHMAEHGPNMCEHVRCWTDSVYNFFSVNIHIERAEGKERKPTFSPVKPPSTRPSAFVRSNRSGSTAQYRPSPLSRLLVGGSLREAQQLSTHFSSSYVSIGR